MREAQRKYERSKRVKRKVVKFTKRNEHLYKLAQSINFNRWCLDQLQNLYDDLKEGDE